VEIVVDSSAPIVRVELFEDRAAVTRRVTIPAAGRQQLRLGPLTPLVTERGLSFPGGSQVTVEEVQIERTQLTRRQADPESVASLERETTTARERAAQADGALVRAREHVARLQRALDAALAASPSALLEQDALKWTDMVAAMATARQQAELQQVELQLDHHRRTEEVGRLEALLAAARAGRPVLQSFLTLGVLADGPTELQVRYVVPCAVWRPAHRAELSSVGPEGGRLSWETDAVCWNATGEDWEGVVLVCSTARPGDLASPPALHDDVLQTRRRDREVVVEARDVTIQVAREGGARQTSQALGVDDGGKPRTFEAPQPVTLRSDGRPGVVKLDQWHGQATCRWLALPERAGQAVLRTVQHNGGSRPLLAGPVSLWRDGTAIGRGKIPLVAPDEPFPLGFGSHDGLRVTRRRDHQLDRTMLTGYQRHEFTVHIRVVHLGAEPVRLEVRERLPTSELKEVQISAPRAEPALDVPVDKDGFVRWTLSLMPGEQRQLKVAYTVEAPSNVRLPF
jgi:uncharacterized protein (TIGR02231 family)